jgi:hypothetical protein
MPIRQIVYFRLNSTSLGLPQPGSWGDGRNGNAAVLRSMRSRFESRSPRQIVRRVPDPRVKPGCLRYDLGWSQSVSHARLVRVQIPVVGVQVPHVAGGCSMVPWWGTSDRWSEQHQNHLPFTIFKPAQTLAQKAKLPQVRGAKLIRQLKAGHKPSVYQPPWL